MAKIRRAIILFLLFFLPAAALAGTIFLSPSSGTYEVGSKITLRVMASSATPPFNAVSGVLAYPTNLFAVDSVSKSGSVLDFWVTEPSISRSAGTIKFEGVALNGFNGSSGTIITVNLRPLKPGTGKLSFQSGQLLANDGQGTDITGNLNGASFVIKAAKPAPPAPVTPPPAQEPEIKPEPEIVQPAPSLKAPEIMLGSKYGAPSIVGTSEYAKAQTLITFISEDGAKIFITGTSDSEGSFNVLIPNSLKQGKYTVTAVMIKSDKTNSDPSNAIRINVGNIFKDISREVWFLILLLILLILYLLVRIYFHLRKDKNKDKDSGAEKNKNVLLDFKIEKAEENLERSFKALEADVADRARGIVNPVERGNIEALEKDIESTKKMIAKDLEDLQK